MRALILAAGYATRLYPLTKDRPKPLLLIGKSTIADYLIQKLNEIEEIDTIYIVTNQKFFDVFNDWLRTAKTDKKIILENDGSTMNDNRLGAIGDIRLILERQRVYDDLLVIAGDNMFDWELKEFADFVKEKPEVLAMGAYDIGDKSKANIYGVVEIDKKGDMVNFLEKPPVPPTSLIATGIYYYPQDKLSLLAQYLKVGNEKDAPGHFIQWAVKKKEEVRCYVFKGRWFDVGDLESYRKANLSFQDKQ